MGYVGAPHDRMRTLATGTALFLPTPRLLSLRRRWRPGRFLRPGSRAGQANGLGQVLNCKRLMQYECDAVLSDHVLGRWQHSGGEDYRNIGTDFVQMFGQKQA